jgi:cytochrome c biogenesis protein CcmG/thiol:disulfide interchange protein DsbE
MKWVAAIPLVVLALLAVLFVGFGLKRDPQVVPNALVGRPMPTGTLPRLDGSPGRLPLNAGIKGPVLLNIFFSTCAPCIQEAPALMALKQQGVKIVGIAYKEPEPDTRAFLERYGNPYAEVLVDRDGRQAIELGASGAPETFLVDGKGMISAKHSGVMTPDKADELIQKAGL